MIIKKFVGKNEEEAIALAKKELGNGIVVMNVKQIKPKGLFGFLREKQTEITVALEEERENLPSTENKELVQSKPLISQERGGAFSRSSGANIEQKLDNLQTLLESRLKASDETNREETVNPEKETEKKEGIQKDMPVKQNTEQERLLKLLYNTMIENEMDEKYVNVLMEDLEKNKNPNIAFDAILSSVYQKMILKFGTTQGIVPEQDKAKMVVFVGPTGVGKTTTIAKLAGKYCVEDKKKIALLTADTYRIAAAEQLRTYADILEVPFRVIYTVDELKQAMHDFAEYDYIFVDTAGHSHQNEEQLSDMKKLIDAIDDTVAYQSFLVLSATTKYKDLLRIADKYHAFTEYSLIFTKLDETDCLGNLYNLRQYTGTNIAYVTYGQNVPEDIEHFDPQKTVKLLLGGKNEPDTKAEVEKTTSQEQTGTQLKG